MEAERVSHRKNQIVEQEDFKIKVLVDEKKLQERLDQMADQIGQDYTGKVIVLLCILKGAVPFTEALAERLERKNPERSIQITYWGLASYGKEQTSSGKVIETAPLNKELKGEDVIICDDIIDSGLTLETILKILAEKNQKPKSLEIAVLLDKYEKREYLINVKYTGFKIPNVFVVGFGLDFEDRLFRDLPFVGVIVKEPAFSLSQT